MDVKFKFGLGDRLHIDGADGILGTVISVCLIPGNVQYKMAWFNNGAHVDAWIDEFRLSMYQPAEAENYERLPDRSGD